MTTVVLVTQATADDDRFTSGQLRELAARFDRVLVPLGHQPDSAGRASSVHARSEKIVTTDAPLDDVLGSIGHSGNDAAVIIDGDLRAVHRAAGLARQHSVPALWWYDGPPSENIESDSLDGIDAVLAPVVQTGVVKCLAIGAGIDTRSLTLLALPPRPPLRLLVLGLTADQGSAATILRALAETRTRGIDAQLVVAESQPMPPRATRRAMEGLIADLALTQSVELLDADSVPLPELLRPVHAVVDAGAGTYVDRVGLEAMACGRPVVTSRPALASLVADLPLPLVYASGDAESLASCLTALADALAAELVELGMDLRVRVEREHSLDQWGASIEAVLDALHAR